VRFIEIDVRESTDGELFLFHDRRLRDGNYRGPDSFQNFPVGIRSARELRSIAVMENGFSGPVVFLREALDDVRAAEACLQLDIKGDSRAVYEKALALAGERGLQSRTFVQCPSLEVLYAVRRYAPEFPVVARVFSEDELAAALPWQPEIVQTDPGMLGSPLVAKAKANGARILVKALGKLDGPTGWESLTKDGADILLTDRPAECIAWASTK
jgi:glycerophosphoryl diester phosphodiesterase